MNIVPLLLLQIVICGFARLVARQLSLGIKFVFVFSMLESGVSVGFHRWDVFSNNIH